MSGSILLLLCYYMISVVSKRLDIICYWKVLKSQIFLFCWQVILLTLGKIRSIFVLFFFFLKAVFLLCRTKGQHYVLLSIFLYL